ncbi:MAG: porin family protein [Muribaculaceae bacterium]|nr:porin family protein [Muribaculaceae bacterium]
MKKITLLICMVVIAFTMSQAQVRKGQVAAGLNFEYGNLTESAGWGAHIQYGIIDNLRAELGFNHFFKHNHVKAFDVNLNAHYLVGLYKEKLYIYPLLGLNYTMATFEDDHEKIEKNHVGLNLGAGAEYEITEHIGVKFEYRHTIIRKVDQGIFTIGANYKF